MALFDEDDRPKRAQRFQPAVLDRWDVEELQDYIATLREEIARPRKRRRARPTLFFASPESRPKPPQRPEPARTGSAPDHKKNPLGVGTTERVQRCGRPRGGMPLGRPVASYERP